LHYEFLTEQIIGAAYKVHNKLGHGFLEKVYENALAIELIKAGLDVEQQKPVNVYYEGIQVGHYYADILVNVLVILELKAADSLIVDHEAQLIHYLRSSEYEVGLLINFGTKVSIKRKIFDNDQKIEKHP
jgi:GxxExxY protein